ncbi:U-box domain-containing protein 44-like protein [Tanacetum coccineum]
MFRSPVQNPLDNLALRPNKTLRQSIEEWKDRNTMITIASMKSKLSSPLSESEEEVVSCLNDLQSLCEQRDIHKEWIVMENYIPTLVKLLGSKNREIRTHALVLLSILAKDSHDAKDRIAKVNGVIEYIVRSLGRRIAEGKLAVELLLELSHHETLRNCIGMVQGCILLLVTMSNSDDNQAATRAKELLDCLSFSDQNVIQMAKANYFTHLLQRLSSGSDDVKMSMVTTLAEMELTDHNKSSLFELGALDSLLNLVSHGDPRMKEAAAKALCNLSSLQKNSIQMIKQGSVNPLVNLLYNHTSSSSLQDEVAAIIMHLAISTRTQNIIETNSEHEQALVHLCKKDDPKVRANAVKLSSSDIEEIASAMGVISNLTQSSQLTDSLLEADGLQVICQYLHKEMRNGPHKNQLIENSVGSIRHFTIPTNQNSQKKVASNGVIPLLVQLLEIGTSLTKKRSSICLGQLSKTSFELSRPIPRPLGGLFKCFSSQLESVCRVHQGICTIESSFCLVEADAVTPLVTLLSDPDYDVCEASLDALLTLVEAERLQYGSKVCTQSIGKNIPFVDLKQTYGSLAHMPLVELTQRGNNRTKSLAAGILAQLNVLHDQSSYF